MVNFLKNMIDELRSFSRKERRFAVSAVCCTFFITTIYAICRPISNSLLIATYSSKIYPMTWLAVVPLNYFAVAFYNKFVAKYGCLKVFITVLMMILCIDVVASAYIETFAVFPFLYYIWKEVYIMLLFHQVWSVIHSTIRMDRAKYLYGLFYGIGGLGGIVGSLVPTHFATTVGSSKLLLSSAPVSALLIMAYYVMTRSSNAVGESQKVSDTKTASKLSLRHGVNLIKKSHVLYCILGVVVFMQVTTALVDYQLYQYLEASIPAQDVRTAYLGKLFTIVNVIKTPMQFFGTFLLVHYLGLRKTHFISPSILLGQIGAFILVPTFTMMSSLFIGLKSIDFSIFGISKEMLYVNLSSEEKFQAKSVIDIFAYRSAKAFASLLIIILGKVVINPLPVLAYITFGGLIAWFGFVYFSLRESEIVPAKPALSTD